MTGSKTKAKSMCVLPDKENTSPQGRQDLKSSRHSMPTPMRAAGGDPAEAKIQACSQGFVPADGSAGAVVAIQEGAGGADGAGVEVFVLLLQ
eukprot:766111-Hanusia_phi.AAC.1